VDFFDSMIRFDETRTSLLPFNVPIGGGYRSPCLGFTMNAQEPEMPSAFAVRFPVSVFGFPP
jgi:hypothetical protein